MNRFVANVLPRPVRSALWIISLVIAIGPSPALAASVVAEGLDGAGLEARTAALQVMDDFLAAFNARDVEAWADTLVYPHVRIASGRVAVFPDRASYVAAHDLETFARTTGWERSAWDDLRVIQVSSDKVHIAVRFTRFDVAGKVLSSFESLYVVEQVDGRWGVRARSSFAP